MHVLGCVSLVFFSCLTFGGVFGEEPNLRAASIDVGDFSSPGKDRRARRQFAIADALKSKPKRRAKGGRALQEATNFQSSLLSSASGLGSLIGAAVETVTGKSPRQTAESIVGSAQLPIQSVPSIGSLLESLSAGRYQNNAISSRLSEVSEVFSSLPTSARQLEKIIAADEYKPVASLASYGASGLSGMVASLASGEIPQMSLLDGRVLPLIGSILPLGTGAGILSGSGFGLGSGPLGSGSILGIGSGISSSIGSSLTGGTTTHLANQLATHSDDYSRQAAIALETSRTIGIELDALLTLFSGGVQIPLINSLSDVRSSFVSLTDRPSEDTVWIETFWHLQQLREDLVRLSNGFRLHEAAAAGITRSIDVIDELSMHVGQAAVELSMDFYARIEFLLQQLGRSVLALDGAELIPRLSLGGIDAAELLSTSVTSLSLDLSLQRTFLANGFDFNSARMPNVLLRPGAIDMHSLSRANVLDRLLLTTVGLVPLSLADATQLRQILLSVQAGFAASLMLVTGGGTGVANLGNIQDVFSMPMESLTQLMNQGVIDRLGLTKLLLLRETSVHTELLIEQLNSGTTSFVRGVPSLTSFLPFKYLGSWDEFFPLSQQLMAGVTRPLSNGLTNGLSSGLSLANCLSLATGVSVSNGLNGGRIDQLLGSGSRRRLQSLAGLAPVNLAVPTTTPSPSVTASAPDATTNGAAPVAPNNETETTMDVESWVILAASAAVAETMELVKALHQAIVADPCMTNDEAEAMAAVRAVAVVGNPVDVLDAGGSADQAEDVLGGSGISAFHVTEMDFLFGSGPNCEAQRDILDSIERWATETQAVFENVASKAFASDAESLDAMLTEVESLDCNIPNPPPIESLS